jgi:hypothetical protein
VKIGSEVSLSANHAAQLSRYDAVATSFALLDDRLLGELVETAEPAGSGIGGSAAVLEIGGNPVFAKRIPLTELETRPENRRSTANLFGLPVFYQYGVGSAGFGAWRELAAHLMTTHWVLANRCAGFPVLYHWRILPGAPPIPDEHANLDGIVEYWHGSPAVRARINALSRASASLVLFLEHADAACAMVERNLRSTRISGTFSPTATGST